MQSHRTIPPKVGDSVGFYLLIPLFVLMAIAQSTVVSSIRLLGVTPDLVLLMVVAWAALRGSQEGILMALVSGVMIDALSGAPFGTATAALVAASYVVGLGAINVFRTARVFPYAAAALATLLYDLVFLFFLTMTGHEVPWAATLGRIVLPSIIINALFMAPVYHVLAWLVARMQPASVEWE